MEGLCHEGVAPVSCHQMLFSLLHPQLPFFEHVHALNPDQPRLGRCTGIVMLTVGRENLFHSAGIWSDHDAQMSHLRRYKGLQMTSASNLLPLFCSSGR